MAWNWIFSNNQRKQLGIALGVVLVIIMFANWFVSYTMQQVDSQFKSVYQDRLIPVAYMSDILERSYQNQMLLDEHLQAGQKQQMDSISRLWQKNSAAIFTVIQKFETTYLTSKEAAHLSDLKQSLAELEKAQLQVFQLSAQDSKAEAQKLYSTINQNYFNNYLVPLHDLIKLQEEVGQELYFSADRQVKSLKVLSYVVIAVAVFIALIIGTLLQTNRKLKSIKPQNFQMN